MSGNLPAVVLALLFCVFAANEINAQGPLGQVLNRMDAYNKALNSLRANIIMVKTDVVLNVSDTTTGSTSYIPKNSKQNSKHVMYVRIDWTKPVEESIVVIGDDYKLYRPKINQAYFGKTSSAKNSASTGGALAFMSMSKAQLKANYEVVYIGREAISGGAQTWHLQLSPKVATSYKLADIWVNTDGLPQQAKVTEKNNDTTTILLTDIRSNDEIKSAVFILTWPKNTKEIRG